jgi:small-conductance mechanosensitive channel
MQDDRQGVERLIEETRAAADDTVGSIEDLTAWVRDNGFQWALAIATVAAVFTALRILRTVVYSALHRKKKPETDWINIIARMVAATNSFLLLLYSIAIVVPIFVELSETQEIWAGRILTIVLAFQFAFWARVIVTAFLERAADKHATHDDSSLANALGLLSIFANVLVFAVALIFIIDNLGGDVTALIAGLGVGGIAIGLAAQSLFEDLFAGLSIILDKPFVRGDFIIFGDKMGSVQKVGLKSTRITTLQGQQLVVNNSKLLDYEINNYRRMAERRVVTKLGVIYQTPRAKLQMVPGEIRRIVEGTERVRFDRCHLAGYGDFAILFELVYWVQDRDYNVFMDVQQDILFGIHALFEENGIEFAFPTQSLHIESVPEGLRPAGR